MRRFLFFVLISGSVTQTHATLLGSVGDRCMQALGASGTCSLYGPALERASHQAESAALTKLARELDISPNDPRIELSYLEARRLVKSPELKYLPIDVQYYVDGIGTFTYRARFNVCNKSFGFLDIAKKQSLLDRVMGRN